MICDLVLPKEQLGKYLRQLSTSEIFGVSGVEGVKLSCVCTNISMVLASRGGQCAEFPGVGLPRRGGTWQ